MKTDIRFHGFARKPVLRRDIERRLFIALSSFERHIDETIVSVRDINGPRGGKDLQGQVIVRLRRGLPIVVRADSDNVHALVSQLASAVRRAVKSRIRRRRRRWMRLSPRRRWPYAMAALADASQPAEPTDDGTLLAV
jgi:hypothetical protein